MKLLSNLLLILLLASSAALSDTQLNVVVSYVSVEHVYVDAGQANGLAIGDRLAKLVNKKIVAEMEVVYVAQNSASCRLPDNGHPVVTGDRLVVIIKAATLAPKVLTSTSSSSQQFETPALSKTENNSVAKPVRLFGNVALRLNSWQDQSAANLDFTQTTARISLRAENIFGENLTLSARSRGRYDIRNRRLATGGAKTEWRNRLWVLSLAYINQHNTFAFSVGRFLPHRLSNIGYLDGGLVSAQLSTIIQTGLFAGRRPEWGFSETGLSLTEYGGYVSYRSESEKTIYIDQTLGMMAEYHDGTPNRIFLAWSGSARKGAVAGISQSIELDINSGWRKAKAGKSVALSNLLIHSWLQISQAVRISLQYDNRQNFWTFERQTLADSLFDSRVRQGIRGRIDLSPIPRTWMGGSLGYRKTSGDSEPVISYSGNIRRRSFFGYNLSLALGLSGFNSAFEQGTNYSIRAQFPPGKYGNAYTTIGGYSYSVNNQEGSRGSQYIILGTSFDFVKGYYIGGTTEWRTGEDINGFSVQSEFGYRFR